MRTIRSTTCLLASALVFAAAACASEAPPPVAPPPPPPAAPEPPAQPPDPAPAAAAPTGAPSAAPVEPQAPPPSPIKDVLGKVSAIEVREVQLGTGPDPVKSVRSYKKAADVDGILKAIGTEQTASGPKRKCPDNVQVSFLDDAGAEKGVLGLCGGLGAKDQLEGAEFGKTMNERGGIQLADAAGLKKALTKAPPGAPKKPTPAASAAPAPSATPEAGAPKKK